MLDHSTLKIMPDHLQGINYNKETSTGFILYSNQCEVKVFLGTSSSYSAANMTTRPFQISL